MTTRLNPYLHFNGSAREAMTFYQSALGGNLEIMTFGDAGMSDQPADLIMHAALVTDGGLSIFGADNGDGQPTAEMGNAMTVSLSSDDTSLQAAWDGLTDGATIHVPFEVAPWGDRFGMFTDKFGVPWVLNQGSDV